MEISSDTAYKWIKKKGMSANKIDRSLDCKKDDDKDWVRYVKRLINSDSLD